MKLKLFNTLYEFAALLKLREFPSLVEAVILEKLQHLDDEKVKKLLFEVVKDSQLSVDDFNTMGLSKIFAPRNFDDLDHNDDDNLQQE